MCKICIDLAKGSMNVQDAKRAVSELTGTELLTPEHQVEVEGVIAWKEIEDDEEAQGFFDEYSQMLKRQISVTPKLIPDAMDDDFEQGDLD